MLAQIRVALWWAIASSRLELHKLCQTHHVHKKNFINTCVYASSGSTYYSDTDMMTSKVRILEYAFGVRAVLSLFFFFLLKLSYFQMSKKPNLKPAPPNLNKLKGSYTLDDSLREKLSLTPDILTGSVKTWSNIKDVVDDYLDHSEVWEAQPQQFVLMLQTSLKTIDNILSKQHASSTSTTELLLKQYCSSLTTIQRPLRISNYIIRKRS